MSQCTEPSALDALAREIDVLIRARYPILAIDQNLQVGEVQ